MNRLVLLLKTGDRSNHFLQSQETATNAADYLMAVIKVLKVVEEEEFELLYDKRDFNKFIARLNDDDQPSKELLLNFFTEYTDYRLAEDFVPTELDIAGIKYKDCVIGALLYGAQCACAIVDHDAIVSQEMLYQIINCEELKRADFQIVPCEGTRLHQWFAENRKPQRVYDLEYDKHTRKEKEVDGLTISAQPYSEDVILDFLKRAVGSKENKRRYLKIDKDNIAVFCDENLQIPTYHGYVVSVDNKSEMQKIKKGNLYRKIQELS